MNPIKNLTFAALVVIISSCTKEKSTEGYISTDDFFSKNGVQLQTYTINGITGGSIISPNGSTITIPANAFSTYSGSPATSSVTVQFKDIYKKSDMLLSDKPTATYSGSLLKSGGEFFINFLSVDSSLKLVPGKRILITQPSSLTGGLDSTSTMIAYSWQRDSNSTNVGWGVSPIDTVYLNASNYVYSLAYLYTSNAGTWGNTDNPTYFSNYTHTGITFHPTDATNDYGTIVFLVYSNAAALQMVSLWGNDFINSNVPAGCECTAVAMGIKDGNLYASFLPLTIGVNQTYNFSLTKISTTDFINQLNDLN